MFDRVVAIGESVDDIYIGAYLKLYLKNQRKTQLVTERVKPSHRNDSETWFASSNRSAAAAKDCGSNLVCLVLPLPSE